MQAIYIFLNSSTHRWAMLEKHLQEKLRLKPLSQTRWESRIEAIKSLRYASGEIYDALFEISQDLFNDSDPDMKINFCLNEKISIFMLYNNLVQNIKAGKFCQ